MRRRASPRRRAPTPPTAASGRGGRRAKLKVSQVSVRAERSTGLEQLGVDEVAEAVDDQEVHLLDAARSVRRNADLDVAVREQRPRSRRRRGPSARRLASRARERRESRARTFSELPDVEIASSTSAG